MQRLVRVTASSTTRQVKKWNTAKHVKRSLIDNQRRCFGGENSSSYMNSLRAKPSLLYITSFLLLTTSYATISTLLSSETVQDLFCEEDEVINGVNTGKRKLSFDKLALIPVNPALLYRLISDNELLTSVVENAFKEGSDTNMSCNLLLKELALNKKYCEILLRETRVLDLLLNRLNAYCAKRRESEETFDQLPVEVVVSVQLLKSLSRVSTTHTTLLDQSRLLVELTSLSDKKANPHIAELLTNIMSSKTSELMQHREQLLKCAYLLTFSKHEKTKSIAYILCDELIQLESGKADQAKILNDQAIKFIETWRTATEITQWTKGAAVSLATPIVWLTFKALILKVQSIIPRVPLTGLIKHGSTAGAIAATYTTFIFFCEHIGKRSCFKGPVFSNDIKSEAYYQNTIASIVRFSLPLLILPVYNGYNAVVISSLASLSVPVDTPFNPLLQQILGTDYCKRMEERKAFVTKQLFIEPSSTTTTR